MFRKSFIIKEIIISRSKRDRRLSLRNYYHISAGSNILFGTLLNLYVLRFSSTFSFSFFSISVQKALQFNMQISVKCSQLDQLSIKR